jgi:[ribosomal protein S18]-alanine N-acetyltransferase
MDNLFCDFLFVSLVGGFIWLASVNEKLAGALVCLHQPFKGFIPGNIIVFVCVGPELRGKKIGGTLMEKAVEETNGDLCLHVEYENPAKRLYERVGFTTKYAEMRYTKK